MPDLLFYVKSKGRVKISHLCLAALLLLTRTVRSSPFSAGGWVSKQFLSFLFFIKYMPDRKLWRLKIALFSHKTNPRLTGSRQFYCPLSDFIVNSKCPSVHFSHWCWQRDWQLFRLSIFFILVGQTIWIGFDWWPGLPLRWFVTTGHIKWHVRPVDIYLVNKHLYWYSARLCGYCTARGLLLVITSKQWFITDYLGTQETVPYCVLWTVFSSPPIAHSSKCNMNLFP